MRCWIASMLAVIAFAVPLLAQGKAADEKGNDRTKQFKDIQEEYKQAVPKVQEAYQKAKTAQDRKAVLAKLNQDFAPRIIKLVKAAPKESLSFNMLVWAWLALPETDSEVFDLFAEHWAKDAKIKGVCQQMLQQPQAGAKKLLQTVLEENKDKDTKGFACFGLAKLAAEELDKGDKNAGAKAEELYERIGKDFADVKLGRDVTLGDQAKGALFEIRHLAIGMKAPNVESVDLDGKKVQLKDYKGKVVVLDIWATWCGPCRAMIPHERDMVKKFKDKPFTFISVSADAEKKTLTDFLKDTSMPWVHWWSGPSSGMVKDWNVQFFPTIYVLDSEGVIRYKHIRNQELEDAVEKLLAEVKK
jgi:thiol-disulfide isomerase/thioredoxin